MAGNDNWRRWLARVTPEWRALALSLLLHACAVALLAGLGREAAAPAPRIALNVVVAQAKVAAPVLAGAVAEETADERAEAIQQIASAQARSTSRSNRPEQSATARRELRQGTAAASAAPVAAELDSTPDTVAVIAPADVGRFAAPAQLQLEAEAAAGAESESAGVAVTDTRDTASPDAGERASSAGEAGVAGGAAEAAVDARALLGEYTALIKRRIEGEKFYPPAAERRGQRGVVRVSFTVGADGGVSGIHVKDGSGFRALDEAAEEAVRRAGQFPEIPPALKRASLSMSIALRYNLAAQE